MRLWQQLSWWWWEEGGPLVGAVVGVLGGVGVEGGGDALREAPHGLRGGRRLPRRGRVLGGPGAHGAAAVRPALVLERRREAAVARVAARDRRVLQLVPLVVAHVHALLHDPPPPARHRCAPTPRIAHSNPPLIIS
jgi:hypothetical protein